MKARVAAVDVERGVVTLEAVDDDGATCQPTVWIEFTDPADAERYKMASWEATSDDGGLTWMWHARGSYTDDEGQA